MYKMIFVLLLIGCLILPPSAFAQHTGESSADYTVIQRENLTQETTSIVYKLLDNKIAYIKIAFFTWQTGEEMRQTVQQLKAGHIEQMIVDLRNNQGGVIYSAIEVAQLLVPKGLICQVEFDDGTVESFYSGLVSTDFEVVVLVNGITASAAEILAAAIKESESGILVGHRTYGKSSIQQMIPTADGFEQKTVGRFVTRQGKDLAIEGIAPDYNVYNAVRPFNREEYAVIDYAKRYTSGDISPGVLAAKQRLSLLGYGVGAIDEVYDVETAAAVRRFQADEGLYPYGVLDYTTQRHLEQKEPYIIIHDDHQLEFAVNLLTLP